MDNLNKKTKTNFFINLTIGILLIFDGLLLIVLKERNLELNVLYYFIIFPLILTIIIDIRSFLNNKKDVITIIHLVLDLVAIVLYAIGYNDYLLFASIIIGIYITKEMIKLVMLFIKSSGIKRILGLIFALSLFATLIFTSITNNNDSATLFNYFGIVTLLEGAIYVIKVIFEKIDAHRLRKVLRETHASEIMFGLFMAMLISGIMLIFTEDSITNIHDALWYTFAIVTTIGFGDFYAVSFIGRIISVILGIYGIIVTALITSIIVNLYNEKQNSNNKK